MKKIIEEKMEAPKIIREKTGTKRITNNTLILDKVDIVKKQLQKKKRKKYQ